VLLDRKNFGPHRFWFLVFLAGTASAVIWYATASWGAANWPSGSSPPGFVCGVAAGALILFEFLLWPRKTLFRVWRIGRTQAWLRAHIWLGLLTVPLVTLHAWRELGGELSTLLVILFAVVIASGLFGLALQQFLPRVMTAAVPGETIYSQIDYVARQYCQEARAKVQETCGPRHVGQAFQPDGGSAISSGGSVRLSSTLLRPEGESLTYKSDQLWQKFDEVIAPYLLTGSKSRSPIATAAAAGNFFRGLREILPPAMHSTVEVLEGFCTERRQFDLQARLHLWLHTWLWVHLPVSAALVVLMFVHVFVALKYW
jgi:hypothetical protein